MKVTIELDNLENTCAALAYASGRLCASGHANVGNALFQVLEQIRENSEPESITDTDYDASNH